MVVIGLVAGLGTATTVPVKNTSVQENISNQTNISVPVYAEQKDIVEGYFRCSCGSGSYQYKKYRQWLDYCPMCGYHDVLIYNPKGADGGEFTCANCDADYCAQDGNNKDYGHSGTRLTPA